MGKSRVELISPKSALSLWKESPHATVFTHPDVLRLFFHDVEWWGAIRGMELVAAWPVPMDSQRRATSSGFFYFVGPIWSNRFFPPIAHRALSLTLDVYTAFIDEFIPRYGEVSASLPPPQTDVRAFSWWKYDYGSPIRIEPRYTARIARMNESDLDDIQSRMRQVRRYEIRHRNIAESLTWSTHVAADELSDLYLERTPSDRKRTHEEIERLLLLTEAGWGTSIVSRDHAGRLASGIILLSDGRTANAAINSVSTDWRKLGLSTHSTWRAIQSAAVTGHYSFDFNGANSPRRGDDKHSYGAEALLYFDIQLRDAPNDS